MENSNEDAAQVTSLDDLTVPEAIAFLDGLELSEAIALAQKDKRKTLIDYALDRAKSESPQGGNQQGSDEDLPAVSNNPMKFVCFHGCPKSFRLKPTLMRLTAEGHTFTTPGLVVITKKSMEAPGLRVIDVPMLDACKRANNRMTPDEVSIAIMDSDYFKGISGAAPTIVPFNEWKAENDYRVSRAAERAKEDEKFLADLKAKRGKRGQAA